MECTLQYPVAVYDVAAGEPAGRSNETTTAPFPYGRSVPTFVTELITGAFGSRKSFADCDTLPAFLPLAILLSPLYSIN